MCQVINSLPIVNARIRQRVCMCVHVFVTSVQNAFELYGADFMMSENYTPWLLEVNSSPGMLPSSVEKTKLCAAVIQDTIKGKFEFDQHFIFCWNLRVGGSGLVVTCLMTVVINATVGSCVLAILSPGYVLTAVHRSFDSAFYPPLGSKMSIAFLMLVTTMKLINVAPG